MRVGETHTLLENTRNETSGFVRTVFEGRGGSVAVQTTHGNAKKCSAGEKLLVILGEPSSLFSLLAMPDSLSDKEVVAHQLNHDKEQIVDDKGPFPPVPISSDTKDCGTERSKHEHKGDAPGNVGVGFIKGLGQIADGQGDGEEVKSVPRLCNDTS